MRTANLEYKEAHKAMIASLDTGVKRPKVQAGNRMSSRTTSDKFDQPRGMRRSSF